MASILDFLPVIAPIREQARSNRESREVRKAQLEAAREDVLGRKTKREAAAKVGGLLRPIDTQRNPLTGEPMSAPEPVLVDDEQRRQAELGGVLAQIAPQATAQALQAPTTPDRTLGGKLTAVESAIGRPLTEKEVFSVAAPGANELKLDQILSMLQIRKLTEELAADRKDLDTTDVDIDTGIGDGLDNLLRLNAANDSLVGTFLESGGSYLDFKRNVAPAVGDVLDFIGADDTSKRIDETVRQYDILSKETSLFATDSLKRMNAAGINVTNALQNLVQSASASTKVSPGTNQAIIKVTALELLRAADRRQLELPERAKYEALLNQFAGQELQFFNEAEAQAAQDAGALKVGDIVVIDGERFTVD